MQKRLKVFSRIMLCSYMVLMIILCFNITENIAKGNYIIDTAESNYGTPDGDLKIKMSKGAIHIEAINTKATTATKWRTIGFYITEKPLESYSYKGHTGYKTLVQSNVMLIGADFRYRDEEHCKAEDDFNIYPGKVFSTYDFEKKSVKKLLTEKNPIDLENITGPKLLYLQPIFQVYVVDDKGNETIEEKYADVREWKTIFGAKAWKNPEDFAKYYNMELQFAPGEQNIKIVYDYYDKTNQYIESETKKTEQRLVNEKMDTYTADREITVDGKDYSYTDSYGENYTPDKNNEHERVKITRKDKKDTILIGCDKVPFGGLIIHINYKEEDSIEENDYVRELNDGSHAILDRGSLTSVPVGKKVEWKVKSQYGNINGKWAECSGQKGKGIYDLVAAYVERKKDNKIVMKLEKGSATLAELKQNSVKVEKGGMLIHLVYEGQEVQQYVREWNSTGKQFDSGVFNTTAKPGEQLVYSVKPKIKKVNDAWKEYAAGSGSDIYDLVKVYVTNRSGVQVKYETKDSVSMNELCNGSVTIEEGGMTVHYVYDGTPPPPPEIIDEVIPTTDSLVQSFTEPLSNGIIWADERGFELFNTEFHGIPTTESVYVQVQGTKYLLGYDLQKRVGEKEYTVKVKKDYLLVWKDIFGKKSYSERQTKTYFVKVKRAYGYWEVANLDYYAIDSTDVFNYVLDNGKLNIPVDHAYYSIPDIYCDVKGGFEQHVIPPKEVIEGITLPEKIIDGGNRKPKVQEEDLTALVNSKVGKITVRNDCLKFNGNVVIPDIECKYDTGSINKENIRPVASTDFCDRNALYRPNNLIASTKLNGHYWSMGTINYRRVRSVNTRWNDLISHTVTGINDVKIHTPVLCNPKVTSDNDKYVQLVSPTEDCVELVIDEDPTLNDFKLLISNFGTHSYKQGYYSRDFSYNLHGGGDNTYIMSESSGLLRNEVKFPFDVYMYQGDGSKEYVKKDTWIIIGRSEVRFHLPMWVNEGVYTVNCRTIAVNMLDSRSVYPPFNYYTLHLPDITKTEEYSNKASENYVATNTFNVEVSGRIYGMNIYELTDDRFWDETFREYQSLEMKKNSPEKYNTGYDKNNYSKDYIYNYTVGIKDQYGNVTSRLPKYTFPLVNGSHPFYKNVGILNKGYAIRFSLETIGNLYADGCKVKIKPSFWYIDRNGENRKQVDLYYSEEFNNKFHSLVKVGNSIDQINLKQIRTGDPYLGIPEKELRETARLRNTTYEKFSSKVEAMFNFGDIRLNYAFRTLVNQKYADTIFASSDATKIASTGIKKQDLEVKKQRWYGEYYIPGNVLAVESGFDVYDYAAKIGVSKYGTEDFWLKDGYLIVNYDIYTINQDGNERLSYTNANNYLNNNNCCMWVQEGFQLEKINYDGKTLKFKYGDIYLYDLDHSVKDDYIVGGTH